MTRFFPGRATFLTQTPPLSQCPMLQKGAMPTHAAGHELQLLAAAEAPAAMARG
jgi:hypothetical protein